MNSSLLTKKRIGSVHVVPALDSDTTLFTIRTNQDLLESQMTNLCCEDEYDKRW